MRCWLILIVCLLPVLHLSGEEAASTNAAPAMPQPLATPPDSIAPANLDPLSPRQKPDAPEELPPFLKRADYLRDHNDTVLAIAYLRQVASNRDLSPPERARAILELADCLTARNEDAEALSWLKIWLELFPGRPEAGAVAYRTGTLYSRMGLFDLARDAYYRTLSSTVNQGEVQSAEDLKQYTRLTEATLLGLAENEYNGGQWARAAKLFDRYQKAAPTASPASRARASFLQADCYYQLKQADQAQGLYEQTLQQNPFHPLAPEARLRLYHLYLLKNDPIRAQQELQALVWTVRTVWPQDESYWQKRTAEFLLTLNKSNTTVMAPLLQKALDLPPEGKPWQATLDHYSRLVAFQTKFSDVPENGASSPSQTNISSLLSDEKALQNLDLSLNRLLPPTFSTPSDQPLTLR